MGVKIQMARRTLIDIDNKILAAVTELGAKDGINAITAQKVAKMCDISHFTCFEHFGTKQNMLDQAAIAFENKYMQILMSLIGTGEKMEDLFVEMLDQLINDPYGTIYYLNYTATYGFKPTPQNINFDMFKSALVKLLGEIPGYTDEMYMLTWEYISSQCFTYARYIAREQMPNTPEYKQFIKNLVFSGVNKVINGEHSKDLNA